MSPRLPYGKSVALAAVAAAAAQALAERDGQEQCKVLAIDEAASFDPDPDLPVENAHSNRAARRRARALNRKRRRT